MKSSLLLDTCAAIWLADGQLGKDTIDLFTAEYVAGRPLYLSPISGWEIGILIRKGHLRARVRPAEYWRRLSGLPGLRIAEMPAWLLLGASFLPGRPPTDPGDRIIAATAREYGYTVVTRDPALLDYARDGHLGAIEC